MKIDIEWFLREDIGKGDVTTDSIIPEDQTSDARIYAKSDCVVAGHDFVEGVFRALDPGARYTALVRDGAKAAKGETVSTVTARTRAILSGERVALNIFQRLSGVATATKQFVDAVEGTGVKILDTRKTTPGMRAAEKYAVRMGGGYNHRGDLAEMALVKENHITTAGSIREAVRRIRARSDVPIEVEVTNMEELRQALDEKVERIMLDNWGIEESRKAVEFVGKRIPLEASGNMTLERARPVALTGVDFISVGSITHSFKSADLSLLITR